MKFQKIKFAVPAMAAMLMISACGQSEEKAPVDSDAINAKMPNGMTVKELAHYRHEQYEKVGDAFKAMGDQLKSDSPDVAAIQKEAASLPAIIEGIEGWFPEGSGPETGVDTDALAAIWENKEDFDKKTADFQAAVAKLVAAGETGDLAAIGAAMQGAGATCKACHDKYRMDD